MTENKRDLNCSIPSGLVQPSSTHPKSISMAVGDPGGPFRRPSRSMSTKTSTPSSRSMRPGCPKLGSASVKS